MTTHPRILGIHHHVLLQRAAAVICCCLVLAACGKKDDPAVPRAIGPDAVKKFRAYARSGGIILAWKPPAKNTDKSPLLDLESFKIYREEVAVSERCAKCPKNFQFFAEYAYKGPRGKVPEREQFVYTDTAVKPGHVYSYKIQCLNERSMLGASSDIMTVFWDVPPAAPSGLRAERRGRNLDLAWEPPAAREDGKPLEAGTGYNIYRSMERQAPGAAPLNPEPLTEPAYQDTPDTYDRTCYYTVRAVRQYVDTAIESAPSAQLAMLYEKLTAPGAPQGLTAIPERRGMLLKWIAKSEPGVAGFNVYRRSGESGAFVRINKELVQENSWLDAAARIGSRYTYAVTAVDQSLRKNESDLSEPVRILHLPQ